MLLTIPGLAGGLLASLAAEGHAKAGSITPLLGGSRRALLRLRDDSLALVDALENRNTSGQPMTFVLQVLASPAPSAT